MDLESTIVAVSSATGAGARMIVRVTGPESLKLASGICEAPGEGAVVRRELRFDGLRVGGWVYRFVAPRSYTGQDLFEFHIPGNPILADGLVRSLVAAGARAAGPGEFTARALFTGKLDLSQAEGVAAVVSAQNRRQLRAARRLAGGELSRRLAPMTAALVHVLTLVEAGIDFADEGIVAISPADAHRELTALRGELRGLLESSERFDRIGGVPSIVLVGRPNAGKSTLLNALCGGQRAVVSSTAGTTRDVLSAQVLLNSGTVRLVDMAGIEAGRIDGGGGESAEDASGPAMIRIGRLMQKLAQQATAGAEVLVLVRDATDMREPIGLDRRPDVIVRTKTDLVGADVPGGDGTISVSAFAGWGLDRLRDRLDRAAFGEGATTAGDGALTLNARHRLAIESAGVALDRALVRVSGNESEWVAAELREALDELGSVTGIISPDDILGRIFSTFCIGK